MALFFILAVIAASFALFAAVLIAKDPLFGICLFVFLSSITITPSLPLIQDRLIVADFIMIYTIIICAFKGQLFSTPPKKLRLIDQLALAFISVATVSSIASMMTGGDVIRSVMFCLIYIYGYCCFRLIIRIIKTREDFERVISWWALGAIIVIIVGFLASTGIYKPSWTFDPQINRISATFKGSGQIASYLGPAIFIFFYLGTNKKFSPLIRISSIAFLFAGLFVLLNSGSRVAFFIMLLSAFLGLWAVFTTPRKTISKTPVTVATGIAVFVFSSFAIAIWTDTSTDYGLLTTSPMERAIKMWSEQIREGADLETIGGTRADEVQLVLENFENHMFLGTGSGLFGPKYRSNEVHNTYFSILGENGLIAFIIFLYWWGMIAFLFQRILFAEKGDSRLVIRLMFYAFFLLAVYQMTTNGMRQRPFWFIPSLLSVGVLMYQAPKNQRVVLPSRRKEISHAGQYRPIR